MTGSWPSRNWEKPKCFSKVVEREVLMGGGWMIGGGGEGGSWGMDGIGGGGSD